MRAYVGVTDQDWYQPGKIDIAKPYGDTSPRHLYNNLIRGYANIRIVFSGHAGSRVFRQDRGVNGNRIYAPEPDTRTHRGIAEFPMSLGSIEVTRDR